MKSIVKLFYHEIMTAFGASPTTNDRETLRERLKDHSGHETYVTLANHQNPAATHNIEFGCADCCEIILDYEAMEAAEIRQKL